MTDPKPRSVEELLAEFDTMRVGDGASYTLALDMRHALEREHKLRVAGEVIFNRIDAQGGHGFDIHNAILAWRKLKEQQT